MLSDCELGCCCCKCHRFTNAALKQASVNKNRRDCINNVFSSNVIWNIIGLNSKLLLLISKIISVISFFMIVLILIEPCGATHLKHRGSTESPRASLVNEAGVFTLRDKQNGGQRSKRTSTTSTSSLRSSTSSTASTNYVSSNSNDDDEEEDVVVEPIALFARKDMAWKTESSNTSSSSSSSSSTGGDIISLSLQTIEPPIELIVKPLSKVVLPCELEGNYTRLLMPAVRSYRIRPASWLHEGRPVDMITIDTRTEMSGTGHRYIGDSSTAALHIDSVKLEDDGTWTCQLEDDRGKLLIGRLVKLVVLEEPKGMYLLIDGRRLDPGNQFVPVKEGSELSLECIVEGGNPAPILAWSMTLSQATLDGPEPLPDNLTIVASISPVRSKAHLKVLRGHHNATIICVVRHITLEMPMSSSILLDVQYTPSFAITRLPGFGIPIIEGMSVSLKCEVDSNPSSAPIWQRDNGPPPVEQSNDGWLNFTQISRAESGWYKCYTRHMLGIFTSIGYFLNVRYDPEIETEAEALSGESRDSRKIEVQIGGAVTLECDGGCWGHGSDMNPVGGPGSLILNRVVYQDAGEYRCVAPDRKMQDTWRAQLPYHVKVKGPPMVYPSNQTMMTNEGDSLDVVVEFCAEPIYTKVLWISEENIYVPGGELRNGVRALPIQDSSTSACYRSILRFEEIQREHAGEWLLLIRSTEGLTNAMVSLNVTHAAGYSHAHMCSPSLMRIIVCLLLLLLCSRHRP